MRKHKIDAGMNGFILIEGQAEFSTTDTTGELATGLSEVFVVIASFAAGFTTTVEAINYTVSGGVVTFTRLGEVGGTVTSGMKINFIVIGR